MTTPNDAKEWKTTYLSNQTVEPTDDHQRHQAALTTCVVMTDLGCTYEEIRDTLQALGVMPGQNTYLFPPS